MNTLKYYAYLFLATIFGACFMWFVFICLQLGLYMITPNWKLDGNFTRYVDGGIALFGAVIGYMNGQNWWIKLYEKNASLKKQYRGLGGIKLRLRKFLKDAAEDDKGWREYLP